MLRTIALSAAAAVLIGGPAFAQSWHDPRVTTVCLDVSGRALPATCRVQATRIDPKEDICQCLKGGVQVTIPVCPAGVKPPPESAAYERERYAMVRKGSLVGAAWRGRPVCVAARDGIAGR